MAQTVANWSGYYQKLCSAVVCCFETTSQVQHVWTYSTPDLGLYICFCLKLRFLSVYFSSLSRFLWIAALFHSLWYHLPSLVYFWNLLKVHDIPSSALLVKILSSINTWEMPLSDDWLKVGLGMTNLRPKVHPVFYPPNACWFGFKDIMRDCIKGFVFTLVKVNNFCCSLLLPIISSQKAIRLVRHDLFLQPVPNRVLVHTWK